MIVVDSNIWNYYFDQTTKEHAYAVKRLDGIIEKEEIVANTVLLLEIAHYLVKKLGSKEGKTKIDRFLELPLRIVDISYSTTLRALNLFYETSHLGIGGRDATILATMKEVKTNRLLSHDAAFKKIMWVKVLDPIPKKI